MVTDEGLTMAWARLFVRCLAQAGVTHAVVCPGSRSTPLALALAEERGVEVSVVVDERSAAFVALGQARVTGRPALVLTTSGSAAAHLHPAVVEADRADVPLLCLTADRPLELAEVSAAQTIDQTRLYGQHVRASFELGVPDAAALGAVPRLAAQAVLTACSPRPGPVHVNARFRKPLEPVMQGGDADGGAPPPWAPRVQALAARGAARLYPAPRAPAPAAIEELAALIRGAGSVMLVAGPAVGRPGSTRAEADAALRGALLQLSRAAPATLFAEVTSGVAGGEVDGRGGPARDTALTALDLALAAGVLGPCAPQVLIEVGAPVVAGRYAALAAGAPAPTPAQPGSPPPVTARVLVAECGFPDPVGNATHVVHADAALFAAALADALARSDGGARSAERRRHVEGVRARQRRAGVAVGGVLDAAPLSEPVAALTLAARLPAGAVLCLGNGLSVRDFDAYGAPSLGAVTVLHQRGAAGIDGLFAGAIGARAVTPPTAPVVLVLGDVSALHDVGSLALLGQAHGALVCLVLDNGGGRIFEELPLARTAAGVRHLERLFVTPPAPFLADAARAFGVPYRHVTDRDGLGAALDDALRLAGPMLVHAAVPPAVSRAVRAAAAEAAAHAVAAEAASATDPPPPAAAATRERATLHA